MTLGLGSKSPLFDFVTQSSYLIYRSYIYILSDIYSLLFWAMEPDLGLSDYFLFALQDDLGTLLSDYVCMFWRVVAYFNCFQISLKLHIVVL